MIRALLMVGLLATGGTQAAAQSLVGKWDCSGRAGRGEAIRTLQEYKANGQLYHLANMAVGDRRGRIDASIAMRGRWEIKGNSLRENFSSSRLRSLMADGNDISNTSLGRSMSKSLPMRMRMNGPSNTSLTKIKFVSPREFRIVSGRIKGTCTKR
ncbi:hypothetical protein GGR95_001219 [Sulfitobacter undariae]|uniref:DUF2147 domain-containing protein n=1 Tax=Sulfitobacter undariae TaxID=1563671 RepID=A0A7W6H0G7_9RHOB|nr:hypothetical protein [Sulfitobacter undariae]MBB3993588.1 hypothetical protein [Sulfitobacter undariae]